VKQTNQNPRKSRERKAEASQAWKKGSTKKTRGARSKKFPGEKTSAPQHHPFPQMTTRNDFVKLSLDEPGPGAGPPQTREKRG